MKPPDKTSSLSRRQQMRTAVPVALYLLHARGSRDAISAPLVQSEFANVVLALEGGIDEYDLALPNHGERAVLLCTGECLRIGDDRFIEFFVPVVVVHHGEQSLDCGVRNKDRPNPIMDQPIRCAPSSRPGNWGNQDLSSPETGQPVSHFVDPQERPPAIQPRLHA